MNVFFVARIITDSGKNYFSQRQIFYSQISKNFKKAVTVRYYASSKIEV